ncbi:MAG: arylsulfatase [Bryobacteraceae bacterium]
MRNLARRHFLGALAAPLIRAQARPPNIVLILADDLGYADLGCYGQKQIATPHLDRLAAEGIRFTQAYAGGAVCAPSRSCLFTGLHNGHTRIRANSARRIALRPEDTTIAEVLRTAGYRTGLIGKWSLGGLGSTGYPTAKGFDEWFGFFSQTHAHNYYPEHLLENDHEVLLRGNTGKQKTEYAQDLFTARALDFIAKERARPFFLHLAYTIPHANNELGRDTGNGMEVPSDEPYAGRDWPQPEKNFAAMITRLDRDVGKVLAALDSNTVVFFTSDNGPHDAGGHDANFFDSNGPLRGIKGELYEGGIRVPAIVRWPGKVRAGESSDHPWAFWDFLPTLAELAGVEPPRGLDGVSIAPLLTGGVPRERRYLYWEHHAGRRFIQAVRMGDWKALRFGLRAPLELYHLAQDPAEETNVAAQHPAVIGAIEGLLATARTGSSDYPVAIEN